MYTIFGVTKPIYGHEQQHCCRFAWYCLRSVAVAWGTAYSAVLNITFHNKCKQCLGWPNRNMGVNNISAAGMSGTLCNPPRECEAVYTAQQLDFRSEPLSVLARCGSQLDRGIRKGSGAGGTVRDCVHVPTTHALVCRPWPCPEALFNARPLRGWQSRLHAARRLEWRHEVLQRRALPL